jgi:hypothetical protein
VTLGKHFLDGRLRTTVGYGDGGLNGVFGGLEAAISPNLALLAEYDTEGANFGLRAAPTPRIHIDLADVGGHLGGQATYAVVMGEREPAPGLVELPRTTEPVEPQALADRLQQTVCALGMENVRAEVGESPQGRTAVVFFENRRYVHDETEALGLALAAATRELPPGISRLGVIVTRYRVPILRVVTNPDDYVRFLRGDLAPERYADMLEIDRVGESPIKPADRQAQTDLAEPTRYTGDIALTPILRALIGTEHPTPSDPENTQTLSLRVSLRPDVYADLGHGLSLRYSHGFHVAGGLVAEVDPYFAEDAAHLSYLFRPFGGALARVAAGDFLGGRRGGIAEGALGLQNDRLLLRGVAGRLSDHRFFGAGPYEWTYVGDIRYHVPALDMTAQATFGRYVDADAGFTVGLRKYLRDVEVEVQYRDTDNGRVLLLEGTIPLGPRAWSAPDPIRLRLADRFSFTQRALIPANGELGLVTTALLVGNQPQEFDLTDSLLNRDRLNAGYLRDHLSTLIRAAGELLPGN